MKLLTAVSEHGHLSHRHRGVLTVLYVVAILVSPAESGSCITVGGEECSPVWVYSSNGKTYKGCTSENGDGKSWCATSVNSVGAYVSGSGNWDWCDRCTEGCETTGGQKCEDEWSHSDEGRTFNGCTTWAGDGRLWCATTVNAQGIYTSGSGQWDWCGDCLEKKVIRVEIVFDAARAVKVSETPSTIQEAHWKNNNNENSEYLFELEETTTTSYSFTQTTGSEYTHQVGVSTSVGGSIKGIIDLSVSVDYSYSTTTSESLEYGTNEAVARRWKKATTVTVPSHHDLQVKATVFEVKVNVPYTGTEYYEDGGSGPIAGTWSGVDYGNLIIEVLTTSHMGCNDYGCDDPFCDWTDSHYQTCSEYENDDECYASFVPARAVDGVDARTACCLCGGGNRTELRMVNTTLIVGGVGVLGLGAIVVFVMKVRKRRKYGRIETAQV